MNANNLELKKHGIITENEIYEIPQTLNNIIKNKQEIIKIAQEIVSRRIKHIYIIGAGSSYHAGFAMSYMFNRITKIPTFCEFSMEFQYKIQPILKKDDCIIGMSQSGETQDTIESIIIAKDKKDCLTIGITNNNISVLAKSSDYSLSLYCREEKSILATKTYINQLAVLSILALEIAKERKTIELVEYNKMFSELDKIPELIRESIPSLHNIIKLYSHYFKFAEFCFILGSGPDYATAMEASLKLKEGARIFGQAYSTAEFPHGPITLADSRTWILALIPHEDDKRKRILISLLERIKERKATILGVYETGEKGVIPGPIDIAIQIPNTIMDFQPLIMILAVQLLTLEISRIKGIDCDTPKFLTKVSRI
ncbi:MAG: SIS domain-containing protein [Candidatus Lokiarchaeota archaeon]|nr:SIS domain-containing protein [Candidatus Lokiarchaeota archaeon]